MMDDMHLQAALKARGEIRLQVEGELLHCPVS